MSTVAPVAGRAETRHTGRKRVSIENFGNSVALKTCTKSLLQLRIRKVLDIGDKHGSFIGDITCVQANVELAIKLINKKT